MTHDAYALTPGRDLLTRLRGKDVLVVFVESYGRVAVEDSWFAPQIDRTLTGATAHLGRLGFHARSGWLGSPTFGGISWLAHSTLQSGLWIDSQQRYDQVLGTDRLTLAVGLPEGRLAHRRRRPVQLARLARGPAVLPLPTACTAPTTSATPAPAWATPRVPDQFTLQAFDDLELRPHRAPVMAEIDLDSSHTPWTSLPRLVPWNAARATAPIYHGVRGAGIPYDTSLLSTLRPPPRATGPLRPVDPLLAAVAGLLRAPRPRQEPGHGRAR